MSERPKNEPPPEAAARTQPFSDSIFARYRERIQPSARVDATKQIQARLVTFTADELLRAIDHFAADPWEMEHNSSRGAPWFFASDRRIEHYVNMTPGRASANGTTRRHAYKPEPYDPETDRYELYRRRIDSESAESERHAVATQNGGD
jgi:hypothetical protein